MHSVEEQRDGMIAVKTDNLIFSYNDSNVIDDVSLTINEGEFVGIIGPNGAGKSTLLRLLCNILPPRAGTIRILEKDLHKTEGKERAQSIAFVPQETHFSLNFSVADIVQMGRYPYLKAFQRMLTKDKKVIAHALTDTDANAFSKRPILSLSSGERQRVVLARALAQDPRILLLDEPTSHLDLHHQREIMELLKTLNSKGITIIIVHHDLNLASLYCQRLVLLHQGRVFAEGDPIRIINKKTLYDVYNADIEIIDHPHAHVPQVILKTT